ncbi:MAG: hypothetical protein LBM66_01860, partial [Bifidobacteriaceae bacterium]|nr:hypothetical protein [Bifidobacteriaceae bacterium]
DGTGTLIGHGAASNQKTLSLPKLTNVGAEVAVPLKVQAGRPTDGVALLTAEAGQIRLRFIDPAYQAQGLTTVTDGGYITLGSTGPVLTDQSADAFSPAWAADLLTMAAGDVDGDGVDEVAVALPKFDSASPPRFTGFQVVEVRQDLSQHRYRWTQSGGWTVSQTWLTAKGGVAVGQATAAASTPVYTSLAMGDFDADGKADLAVAWDATDWSGVAASTDMIPQGVQSHLTVVYGGGGTMQRTLGSSDVAAKAGAAHAGVAAYPLPSGVGDGLAFAGYQGNTTEDVPPAGFILNGDTCRMLKPTYHAELLSASAKGAHDLAKSLSLGQVTGGGTINAIYPNGAEPVCTLTKPNDAYWLNQGVKLAVQPYPQAANAVVLQLPDRALGVATDTGKVVSTSDTFGKVPGVGNMYLANPVTMSVSGGLWGNVSGGSSSPDAGGGPYDATVIMNWDAHWGHDGLELTFRGSTPGADISLDVGSGMYLYPGAIGTVLLNTDRDATTFVFDRWETQYSDPTVIGILAAPPYFKDVADLDPTNSKALNDTALTSFSGSESSSSASSKWSAGAYVSMEEEVPDFFGIKGVETQMDTDFQHSETTEYKDSTKTEFSIEYGAEEDTVILTVTPCDVFYYTAYASNADGTAVRPVQLIYRVPRTPINTEMTLEQYREYSEAYGLPEIGSDIVKHTEGYPSTYQNYDPKSFDFRGGGGDGVWETPGWGENSTTQSVELETTKEKATEMSDEISFKVGAGGGGMVIGASGGSETSTGSSTADFSGSEFTGKIHGFPEVAGISHQAYGFSWMLVEKKVKVGGSEVPYVTYAVKDVTSPVLAPRNFRLQDVTATSASFAWDPAPTVPGAPAPTSYQLLRLVQGTWMEQDKGEVTASQTLLTLDNLAPGLNQQFAIEAKTSATDVTQLAVSARSPGIAVITPQTEGVPVLTAAQTSLTTILGGSVDMSVTAMGVDGTEVKELQWQKWDEEDGWQPISGATGPNLHLGSVVLSDFTRYRCMGSQLIGTENRAGYSNSITLSLGPIASVTQLAVVAPFGIQDIRQGDVVKATASINNASAIVLPTGSFTFQVAALKSDGSLVNQGNATTIPVTANSATLTMNISEMAVGPYRLTVTYSGDGNYHQGLAQQAQFFVASQDGDTTHQITASVDGSGTITPSGALSVLHGSNQEFTAAPAAGYVFSGFKLDGGALQTGPTKLLLANVTADHQVQAVFTAKQVLPVSTAQQVQVSKQGTGDFQVRGVPDGLSGFTVTHTLDGKTADTAEPGVYDVSVTRAEDATYQAVNLKIPEALLVVDRLNLPALRVMVSGPTAALGPGDPLLLTATVSPGVGEETYTWLKDGEPVATGSKTYEVAAPTTLDSGSYQFTVTRTIAAYDYEATETSTPIQVTATVPPPTPTDDPTSDTPEPEPTTDTPAPGPTTDTPGPLPAPGPPESPNPSPSGPGTPTDAAPVVAGLGTNLAGKGLFQARSQTVTVRVVALGPTQGAQGVAQGSWRVANPKTATVTSTGGAAAKAGSGDLALPLGQPVGLKVKALKVGRTTVVVTAGGAKAQIKVTVVKRKVKVKTVALKAPKRLKVGAVKALSTVVRPAKATGVTVTWSSSKPGVLRIDAAGRVRALRPGKAVVKAKLSGKTVKKTIQVK